MVTRDEILEYPYNGVITRTIDGDGDEEDYVEIIYDGVMDEHMLNEVDGRSLQTATYIISIPLIKTETGKYNIPRKGDNITLERYGEELSFVIDNVEPSQLGGVSIYATQKDWKR